MTNTDSPRVEATPPSVKPTADGDTGANVYGIGLAATNDATHLAKMAPVLLLREFISRTATVSETWGPDMTIDSITTAAQSLNRCHRELLRRMDPTAELGLLRALAARAKDWQERDHMPSHNVNDAIDEYARMFPAELHAALVSIGERPPYRAGGAQ